LYRRDIQELKGSYFGIRDDVKGSVRPDTPFTFFSIFPARLVYHTFYRRTAETACEP
jgi:hypothetical protein